jgi:hypothetical protein
VDEVRQVGSFKQGTILAGHKAADFVVILKTLPVGVGGSESDGGGQRSRVIVSGR